MLLPYRKVSIQAETGVEFILPAYIPEVGHLRANPKFRRGLLDAEPKTFILADAAGSQEPFRLAGPAGGGCFRI